jgi:hypothetical protein
MVWEGKEIAFNEQKKDYLEACKQGLLANDAVSKPPEPIESPPVKLRLTVGDITSQQLVLRYWTLFTRRVADCHTPQQWGNFKTVNYV